MTGRNEGRAVAWIVLGAPLATVTAIPDGPAAAVVIGVIVAACLALAQARLREVGYDAVRDARLASEVRDEIAAGRIPEGRDRLRRASGPLARVLLGVFRFPYGVHREAVEMAWAEATAFERREHPAGGTPLPILAGVGLVIGVASDLAHRGGSPFAGTPTLLGVLGACVGVGLWLRLRRASRRAAERLETLSAEITTLIIAFTESPQIAGESGDPAGAQSSAIGVASPPRVERPEFLHP